ADAQAMKLRWFGAFTIALSLIATALPPAEAQEAQHPLATAEQTGLLILAGRDLDAIELAKQLPEAAPPAQRQEAYRLAAQVCMITFDMDCAKDVYAATAFLDALPVADRHSSMIDYAVVLWAVAHPQDHRPLTSVFGPDFPFQVVTPLSDPVLFAE